MPGWIATVLSGVAAFFGWRHAKAQADLREMDREAGQDKQRASTLEKGVAVKDAQLEIAAKPARSRAELLAKAKGRKRSVSK